MTDGIQMQLFAKFDLIIFDFHRTLTNSVYFDQFDPPTRNLISDLVFRPPKNEFWDRRWMTGAISCDEVLDYLSRETSIPRDRLDDGLRRGIREISWNQNVWDFSQAVREYTKTAIATINNDVFSRFIVPGFNLAGRFDVIVNSYEMQDDNKTQLCISAAAQLGMDIHHHRILLIDDKQKNIDGFTALGGQGYLYEDELSFLGWVEYQSRTDFQITS